MSQNDPTIPSYKREEAITTSSTVDEYRRSITERLVACLPSVFRKPIEFDPDQMFEWPTPAAESTTRSPQ